MRILIALNLAVNVLLAAGMVAFEKSESSLLLLANMGLLVSFYGLAMGNLVSIFTLWKRHGIRALIPFGSFAVAAVTCFFGARYGTEVVLRGTPERPNSFFQQQTKEELTRIAQQLIGNGFKEILTYPNKPTEIRMIAGHQEKEVAPEISTALRRYGFQRTYIDDFQGIVTFSFCHMRTWCDYTWAKNRLSEPYSMPATITEVDIEDWKELISIAEHGTTRTGAVSFDPSIVYPYFKDAFGQGVLDRMKGYRSTKDISDDDKSLVLSVLNKHRLASSALVEHSQITYARMSGLRICSRSISDGFWVVTLLKRLLSEGVLKYAADGCHLKIRPDLTDKERTQVEWLHVGLMNFIYGNLVDKRQHPFRRDLGDNWYFDQQ